MAAHDWPRFRFVEPANASLNGVCIGDEFDYASADRAMARAMEYLDVMDEHDHVDVWDARLGRVVARLHRAPLP